MQIERLPAAWRNLLADEFQQIYFAELAELVATERKSHTVFPPEDEVFAAFEQTLPTEIKAVLLGQDPYHGKGQAHGLCFSVRRDVRVPPSLRNIFKELESDIGCAIPATGDLTAWARRGVFLLNTVLTVRERQAGSHQKKGWERFTDRVIEVISAGEQPVVFLLWGRPAQSKKSLIDTDKHRVIESAHPSPLSARNGFFGSRPFSRANTALIAGGRTEIPWCLD